MTMRFWGFLTCLALAVVLSCGCSKQVATDSSKQVKTIPVSLSDEAKSKLVEADKLDGKEDHVIQRCYSCALGMEGKTDFAAEVDGYTVQFCSENCREHFEKDPQNIIASTEIPPAKK